MKKFKFLAAVFTLLAMILTTVPAVKTYAATPDTWTICFDTNRGEWTYKLNGEGTGHWELYYFYNDFKDGDKLVVDGANATKGVTVDLNKRVSELAFATAQTGIVNASYVDYVYSLSGAIGVVNGNVGKASVTDDATLQINGNAKEVYAKKADGSGAHANVNVSGTVDYAEVAQAATGLAAMPAYNFATGSFSLINDSIYLQTATDKYSTTGTAPSSSRTSGSTDSDKELDSVPKTGGFDFTVVFFAIGFVFMIGAIVCSKKMYRNE
jgi:hypothetical protein